MSAYEGLCPDCRELDCQCQDRVDARRYRALRDHSTKDLGVRRKSGWTYIAVTGPQLDRAADILAAGGESGRGQHPTVQEERNTGPELG